MIYPYQIVILVLVLIFIGYTILNYRRGEVSFISLILWLVIWISIIYMNFNFKIISFIQTRLLVQAGLNVIIVFSIIVLLFVSHVLFIQITRIRKEITQIVRYIGLKEAERHKPES